MTTAAATGFLNRLQLFSGEIRVQESVFALPFAYTGMVLAADGGPTWSQFVWVTVAMVSARTLGMSANRIIDRHIDSRNPRTSGRHLASGRLRTPEMVALSAIAAVVFFADHQQLLVLVEHYSAGADIMRSIGRHKSAFLQLQSQHQITGAAVVEHKTDRHCPGN